MAVVKLPSNFVPARLKLRLKQLLQLDRRSSYSQFGEDAFCEAYYFGKSWTREGRMVFPHKGSFVDVGAYSPMECSNTYAFYRRGWRGINIDAAPGMMRAFKAIRPGDTNLNLAIGTKTGVVPFYCWGLPSVFNTADPELASRRTETLGRSPKLVEVRSVTLAWVLEEYLPADVPFRLLSVDVEGRDLDVLASNDWSRFRPELLVAEYETPDIDQFRRSAMYEFISDNRYELIGWLQPSAIFKDRHAR